MSRKEHTINEYLEMFCSLLIEQFNMEYKEHNTLMLTTEADRKFNDMYWTYRIGENFRNLAQYEIPQMKNADERFGMAIPSKNYIVDVKYLHTTSIKCLHNVEKSLKWLHDEIVIGHNGTRAVVLVWCKQLFNLDLNTIVFSGNDIKLLRLGDDNDRLQMAIYY